MGDLSLQLASPVQSQGHLWALFVTNLDTEMDDVCQKVPYTPIHLSKLGSCVIYYNCLDTGLSDDTECRSLGPLVSFLPNWMATDRSCPIGFALGWSFLEATFALVSFLVFSFTWAFDIGRLGILAFAFPESVLVLPLTMPVFAGQRHRSLHLLIDFPLPK